MYNNIKLHIYQMYIICMKLNVYSIIKSEMDIYKCIKV